MHCAKMYFIYRLELLTLEIAILEPKNIKWLLGAWFVFYLSSNMIWFDYEWLVTFIYNVLLMNEYFCSLIL